MLCLGFEPGAAEWNAQTDPLSYGGHHLFITSSCDFYVLPLEKRKHWLCFTLSKLLHQMMNASSGRKKNRNFHRKRKQSAAAEQQQQQQDINIKEINKIRLFYLKRRRLKQPAAITLMKLRKMKNWLKIVVPTKFSRKKVLINQKFRMRLNVGTCCLKLVKQAMRQ